MATKYDIAALSDLQQIALTPSDDIRRYNAEFGKTSKKATKVAKRQKVTNDSIRNKAPELVTSNSPQLDSIESTMKQLAASMEAMTAALAAISAKS